jgi:hypothetical protein
MTLATEGKPDSKAERAARRAEARAAKRKAEEETADRRRKQLDAARLITAKIDERLQTARCNTRRYEGLSSQLTGFYEEIDKLTKGKAMLEVTDLVVEKTNDVIRDAKGIIEGDTYLDRIKEFVPAGNNPVYPDVLLTLRTVQQCLIRFANGMEDREKGLLKVLNEGRTVVAALECHLAEDKYALKENVKARLDSGSPAANWFWEDQNGNNLFDFDKLDRRTLEDYFGRQV